MSVLIYVPLQVFQTVNADGTSDASPNDEAANISSLTAEIESFVKTADTDKEKLRESPEKVVSRVSPPQHQQQQQKIQPLHIDEAHIVESTPAPSTPPIQQEGRTVVARVTTTTEILRESANRRAQQSHITSTDVECNNVKEAVNLNSRQSPENNEFYPEVSTDKARSCEKLQNLLTEVDVANNNVQRCKKSPVKILIRAPTDEEPNNNVEEVYLESVESKLNGNTDEASTSQSTEVDEILENTCRAASRAVSEIGKDRNHSSDDKPLEEVSRGPDRSTVNAETVDATTSAATKNVEITKPESSSQKPKSSSSSSTTTVTTSIASAKELPEPVVVAASISTESITELKITESTDDLTQIPSSTSTKSTIFEVRNVPLKGLSPSMVRKEIDLRKEQEDDERNDVTIREKTVQPQPTTAPTPPQRRRSVKEIIESINKSQSLLKINQKPAVPLKDESKYKIRNTFPQPVIERNILESQKRQATSGADNGTLNDDLDALTASEKHMKQMIAEMEADKNGNDSELANIPLFVERFAELNNNNRGLFQKCSFKREDTPDRFMDNDHRSTVDWNPLPKPRRTKN